MIICHDDMYNMYIYAENIPQSFSWLLCEGYALLKCFSFLFFSLHSIPLLLIIKSLSKIVTSKMKGTKVLTLGAGH